MFNIVGYDREIIDRVLNESLVIPLGLEKNSNFLQLMFIFFEEVSKGCVSQTSLVMFMLKMTSTAPLLNTFR